ncbi:MAG: hypothetical protein MAG795_01256 [Candidatus Woesearchaeota archaeon]|nr:hypothetical protein [Candidatus Woesearchaeota archaeon]
MTIRQPLVSGQFYASDITKLENQIKKSFLHKKGPGTLPISKREGKTKAVICPHAGYSYSGPCAAWSYKEIAESKIPDTYVLIGPNHRSNKTSISLNPWRTPFGIVNVDKKLGKAIANKSKIPLGDQQQEHSLEVQLPFLQYVNKQNLRRIRILPIALSEDVDLHKLALDIKEILMDQDKEVTYIISSDFTHYGSAYRYVPFSSDIQKRLYKLDLGAIKLIQKRDSENLKKYMKETGATICGIIPLLLLSKLVKTEGELLQYYTSADLAGDYKQAVGYASIVFR